MRSAAQVCNKLAVGAAALAIMASRSLTWVRQWWRRRSHPMLYRGRRNNKLQWHPHLIPTECQFRNRFRYLVLETWSSEGRNGLLTVAEEVLPNAVSPRSLIWDRPKVLASRGLCSLRQIADATSAFTNWIFMYVRPLVMTGVESGNMLTPSALISTDTEDGQACHEEEGNRAKHAKWKITFNLSELQKKLIKSFGDGKTCMLLTR